MRKDITTCIKWSMLELRGLLEDEDSRVTFQRAKRHLGIHPFHLNDLNAALREILDATVNTYDPELQGLVLAYKNPKLVSPLGAILHDSHFIHIDVEADFYVFKPEIGCVLKGIANKKAANHIAVLVHKVFNVSISKPEDDDDWHGNYVYVGQEVKFTVKHMDFKEKLPFVRGELLPDGISRLDFDNEESALTSDQEDKKNVFIMSKTEPSNQNEEVVKKHSKKVKTVESDEESADEVDRNVFKVQISKVIEKKTKKSKTKISKLIHATPDQFPDEQRTETPEVGYGEPQVSSDSNESDVDNKKSEETPVKATKKKKKDKIIEELLEKKAKKLAKKRLAKENETLNNSFEPETLLNGSHGVSSSESEEIIDKKTKISLLNGKKSPKKKHLKEENASSNLLEDSVNEEPTNSTKSPKKKQKGKLDSIDANNSSQEESTDKKPNVNLLDTEKSSRKKSPKKTVNEETSSKVETPVEKKVKIKSEKSAKSKQKNIENSEQEEIKNSNLHDENQVESVDRKPNVGSLAEKSPKKKSSKKTINEDSNSTTETSVEEKPRINHTIKSEKSAKSKQNNIENSEPQESEILNSKSQTNGEESPEASSPRKRSKKAIESGDEEDLSRVKIKSEHQAKKKVKVKKQSEESEKSEQGEEAVVNRSENSFDFVKPEVKAEHKKKRRKNVESEEAVPQISQISNEELPFDFRNVRIKQEPDPSDVEDSVPREKSPKRKRKLSTRGSEEMNNETSLQNIRVKIEPVSDVEDSKSSKKKLKRKKTEAAFEDTKIKVEANASDVEGSRPKSKFKTEPPEKKARTVSSPPKLDEA